MKTLVIHPKDPTTDFLKLSYQDNLKNPDWTLIDNASVNRRDIFEALKTNDRIIMIGHGSEYGLMGNNRTIINSKWVYLLREKYCIGIWCLADQFFQQYGLKGVCSGMIISEDDEAEAYNIKCDGLDIAESNQSLSECLGRFFTHFNIAEFCKDYRSGDNPVMIFNQDNFYIK